MGQILIPDVSEWQGSINPSRIHRAGYAGLVMRSVVMFPNRDGSVGMRADHTFNRQRVRVVRANGLVPGFYAYLVPSDKILPRVAARFVWETIRAADGLKAGDLAFWTDIEQSLMGWNGTREWESEFNDHFHGLSRRGTISYDPAWFWSDRGAPREGTVYVASDYRYHRPRRWEHPSIPNGFKRDFYFWQYTDRENVPGVGPCDVSVFRGTRAQFNSLRYRRGGRYKK